MLAVGKTRVSRTMDQSGNGADCPTSPQTSALLIKIVLVTVRSACASGKQTRSFTVTTDQSGNGADCPTSPQTKQCTADQDCAGNWGHGGLHAQAVGKTRSFTVTTDQSGNGADCPTSPQTKQCTADQDW